jgi:3-hydroxy-9,10-secoandrosta-1,3,5(10)-triene-9,17-dione monooxygenase reductase component
VLVCVDKQSDSHGSVAASEVFAVNILSHRQETLSRRFAKSGGDKFAGIGYRLGVSGAPILEDTLAHLECRLLHAFDAGDHTIYVGEAIDVATGRAEEPLLFFRGGYRNTAP